MIKGKIHSLESFGTVDGPGIRFVVFMQGCPLRCLYCHNPDTWNPKGKVKYQMTPGELLTEVLRYKSFIARGGVTVTGGALDTSGFVCTSKAWEVLDYADLVLLDIKTLNPDLHPLLAGVKQDNTLLFLDELERRGIDTWIRHVIVPGYTDNDEWLEALARYVSSYKVVRKVELLPYHTMGTYKYEQLGLDYPLKGVEPLSKERLDNAKAIFSRYKPENNKA